MTKILMNKLRENLFLKYTYGSDNSIPFYVRVDLNNFDLNIVEIVFSLVG